MIYHNLDVDGIVSFEMKTKKRELKEQISRKREKYGSVSLSLSTESRSTQLKRLNSKQFEGRQGRSTSLEVMKEAPRKRVVTVENGSQNSRSPTKCTGA